MGDEAAMLLLGGELVPVLRRSWRSGSRQPYRKTYALQPGQHWTDAPVTEKQWEHYVLTDEDRQVPVGSLIAMELIEQGAQEAVFTELWSGKCVLVSHELRCVAEDGGVGLVLAAIRETNHGKLGGLPDVIAIFPDGRIAFREAKNVAAGDRVGPKQHELAKLLRQLFGARADLAIVEWG